VSGRAVRELGSLAQDGLYGRSFVGHNDNDPDVADLARRDRPEPKSIFAVFHCLNAPNLMRRPFSAVRRSDALLVS
jgi:hypothetical protein